MGKGGGRIGTKGLLLFTKLAAFVYKIFSRLKLHEGHLRASEHICGVSRLIPTADA